ncbi:rRNA maturation RNase YbeY [Pseudohalocynthiibacter aestuariivivens]|uniref:Endoribonuclease YbeY n=1 Tax=Roseovarius pelagicus TaxID=2980108 RepID=A0ABY6DHH1_9RHOB|nr:MULTISPECIES: rRNA maturation RNase YbeY [Rhodobacterales]QIE44837.1 rRNA maturation RNase YbeY [Pseudohalocynthiibacter aestuariivivens]UXX83255.1 rRNA maturation RNase YbeY [Roseovarius pelagicus]
MSVDIIIEDARWERLDIEPLCTAAADTTLTCLGLDAHAFEISVLACDDARIAALNTAFRDKPQPTNVLSWPSAERGVSAPGGIPILPEQDWDSELGDIAIAYDTCAAEAAAADKPLRDHATHLIVHAVLHLLGYDHMRDADATLMESLEIEILGKMGLNSPY